MDKFKSILTVAVLTVAAMLFTSQANAQRNAYGGLYVLDGATTQALATTAAKLTAFTTVTESSTQDGSIVPSVSGDNIALLANGVYLIHLDVTASVGTADIQVTYALRNGSTAIAGAECRHEGEAADVPSNASLTWIYKPTAAATLNVYVESESSTPNLTVIDAQLVVVRLQ